MPSDALSKQIEVMFGCLQRRGATKGIPVSGTLSNKLASIAGSPLSTTANIDAETLSFFATASVEMWHRSVHSFLISASLTKASPLWASVSGYYSSHYSIRALAHLLGYFQLHNKKCIVQVDITGTRFICNIIKKMGMIVNISFIGRSSRNMRDLPLIHFLLTMKRGWQIQILGIDVKLITWIILINSHLSKHWIKSI